MKGSGKILSVIAGLTCLMLVYVHLQIASVIVSVELHKTSRDFSMKQELLRRLQFNVEELKAPRLLEEKMKNHDLALGLPKKVEVVEVPAVPEFFLSQTAVPEKADPAPASSISKFFGHLIQTAQAKTELSS